MLSGRGQKISKDQIVTFDTSGDRCHFQTIFRTQPINESFQFKQVQQNELVFELNSLISFTVVL